MKIIYGLFLFVFLSVVNCFSQDTNIDVIYLNKIPPEGILLDKGWKFQPGDNPEYAKPDYDDRAWQTINPTLDIHDSLLQMSKSGIGWFRLHFSLDTILLKSQLALVIQQSAATEIYLNGHKIQSFGIVSSNAEKVKAYDPLWKPLPLTFHTGGEQLLAIRFAIQPKIFYTTVFETANPAIAIRIMYSDDAIDYYHGNASRLVGFSSLLIGISIMIIILHLSFYLLYPSQKANLYFALFAVMFGLASIVQLFFWLYPDGVANKFYLGNITFALFIVGYVYILKAAYHFLQRKKDFFYYALLVFAWLAVIFDAWPYGIGWKMGGPMLEVFAQINIARIAFLAVFKRQRGAWIIAAGAVCSFIFFATFISWGTFTNKSFILSLPPLRIFTYIIFNLSLPAATSVFLAFEFAFANRTLQQKLLEVNNLSQKNLAQEKEKQEMLALQNETLELQVTERTSALNKSLENLKSTQAQLIQSEKMASLGELTAGIAHEIQNPLNFVNNFSEVNAELIEELKSEKSKVKSERDEKLEDDLLNDISENEKKINHHGKRAGAIVKGMLQHSQKSTGKKEPTDISALAEEYLKLSYHGLRAKDKSFNATMKTDFDESIGKINIVPQDIGRVLLNLINNAFYAVSERGKAEGEKFEPTVSVSTKKVGEKISVSVKDNGNGIPQKIVDKIFQPFFTTKPTGQGTGLGLSLSYDIVKAHGGEIKVETKEGEYANFFIILPISNSL